MNVHMRPCQAGDERVCERILRSLPDWFGIEDAIQSYIKESAAYPTWYAMHGEEAIGIITLHRHFDRAAEIHLMAVLPEHHHCGIGRQMVAFAENHLRAGGIEYLQVKTQGPSRPCAAYVLTQKFYEAMGFVPLEEFPKLWPGNPALQMIKKIG